MRKIIFIYKFQYKLFKYVIQSKKSKNIVISPFSIHQIISLASNGALGSTQQQMVNSLTSVNVLELNYETTQQAKLEQDFSMKMNAIFTKCTPKQSFIELAANKFNSTIEKINSAEQINSWAKSKTKNKVTSIIENVNNASMLLLNAVCYRGNWNYIFDRFQTKKEIFNGTQTVDMMHQTFEDVNFYQNSIQMSTIIMLPAKDIDINDYASSINSRSIHEYIKRMDLAVVKLSIPKFEFTYEIVLNDIMKRMGMKDAFDESKAKFNNICESTDLFINEIKHKVVIKFNEYGIDAPGISMKRNEFEIGPDEKINEMNVNRPFFFGIKNKDAKHIFFFMGVIEEIPSITES